MRRGDIYSIGLDPTIGAEMQKTRPCVVVSPDEMNAVLQTVTIVPVTSTKRELPTWIPIKATPQSGLHNASYAVLHQVKAVDKTRALKKIGHVSVEEEKALCAALCTMFAF